MCDLHERSPERADRMSDLENGMLVEHASLGVGRVVALEPNAVHVFFANGDARFATKLRLPMALPLLKPSPAPNAWLSGLPGFALDAKTGRYGFGGTAWLSHGDAVERFVAVFPEGFEDPGYLADGAGNRERSRSLRAWQSGIAPGFPRSGRATRSATRDRDRHRLEHVRRRLRRLRLFRGAFCGEPSPLRCFAGYNSIAVDNYGKIYPCLSWLNWGRPVGSLREQSLAFTFEGFISIPKCLATFLWAHGTALEKGTDIVVLAIIWRESV